MNLLEIYVTNITSVKEVFPNVYEIVADFNCYGRKEIQVAKTISVYDYEMIKEKGYYLG